LVWRQSIAQHRFPIGHDIAWHPSQSVAADDANISRNGD
jgi:hypothetical protein